MAGNIGNVATHGAKQTNSIYDISLIKNVVQVSISRATEVATAQEFGSPLKTKYSYDPLRDLIRGFGHGDIEAKRYHGLNIYESLRGKMITSTGHLEELAMDELIKHDGERLDPLGSLIVCLSVPLTKTVLSYLIASAIMLHIHGSIDRTMEGAIRMLQGKVEKYAVSIISRDGMCNKLENAKQKATALIQRHAPRIRCHSMFLPPRGRHEEGDFIAFIAQLWSAKAEGQRIFTRSIKLMAFSLLLSEYGWQIDIFIEEDSTEKAENPETTSFIPIKADTNAISVIYSSLSKEGGREYVENHAKYSLLREDPYISTVCMAIPEQMGKMTALSLSKNEKDEKAFLQGYKAVNELCTGEVQFNVTISLGGFTKIDLVGKSMASGAFAKSCRNLLGRFSMAGAPEQVKNLVVDALCHTFPDYDWDLLDNQIQNCRYPDAPFTTLLTDSNPDDCLIWVVAGAVLAVFHKIVLSLANIPATGIIRTPAGPGIHKFVQYGTGLLNGLLEGTLQPSEAVLFCAAGLAGADPEQIQLIDTNYQAKIVGYWGGQYGLLLTPLFERSLYSDMAKEKMKPITFHNIPIMGMSTDERGWVRSGSLSAVYHRSRTFSYKEQHSCDVIMEYRPHFEEDSRCVVAVVYLDGVFYKTFPLSDIFSTQSIISSCSHTEDTGIRQKALKHITLDGFEPGETTFPKDGEIHVIIPQQTAVTRLLCLMAYRDFQPVIQNGCLDCAVIAAEETQSPRIIIPRILES